MLQILSNYGNINNIENKQQANTMKTIRITLKDAKKLKPDVETDRSLGNMRRIRK